MRTTIVALLAILVFFSLSCQKDSSVESAGNNTRADNVKSKNKTFQNGDNNINYRYHAHVRIYQDNQEGEEQKVVDTVYQSNAMQYDGNSTTAPFTFPTLPGNEKTTFHLNFEFSWQNCCTCNLYTSAVPVECEFVISKYVSEGDNPGWHDLMRTTLVKQYGKAYGTETVDYPILFCSVPFTLEPDTPEGTYGFTVSWVQHPYLYNQDQSCSTCNP
jgi:hypothetical protein